jgi:hypothetical protein
MLGIVLSRLSWVCVEVHMHAGVVGVGGGGHGCKDE